MRLECTSGIVVRHLIRRVLKISEQITYPASYHTDKSKEECQLPLKDLEIALTIALQQPS